MSYPICLGCGYENKYCMCDWLDNPECHLCDTCGERFSNCQCDTQDE